MVDVSIAPANATTRLAACNSDALAALAKQRCRVTSALPDLSACTLTLPCMGDFVLRACAVRFANGTNIKAEGRVRGAAGAPGPHPCNEAPLGRNLTTWQVRCRSRSMARRHA